MIDLIYTISRQQIIYFNSRWLNFSFTLIIPEISPCYSR